MAYIGLAPTVGDSTTSFRLLDDIQNYTCSFDASSSSIVSTSNNTITINQHRFITGQRITYGIGGGTAIGGLTDGTVYYIIKNDTNTIKLATSAANATAGTAISLTGLGVGTGHTLLITFDGINTKFKATYNSGTIAKLTRAGQLLISINGVLQQPIESNSPSTGFGLDNSAVIVFSTAPAATDKFFGEVIANTSVNFDTTDNTVDNLTGDASTTKFTLSKNVVNNDNVLVTLDGVVQYPNDNSNTRAYNVVGNEITFTSAPGAGIAIQVRHIGFSGAATAGVTGFYGRTGNVTLSSSSDNIIVGDITASGNVSIAGTLTYEDVTNIDAVGLITARDGIEFGTRPGLGASISSYGNAIFSGITTIGNTLKVGTGVTISLDGDGYYTGVVTATSYQGDGSSLTGISGGITTDVYRNSTAGANAGDSFTSGQATDNTLIGYDAGTAVTTGDQNTALGSLALAANTTAGNNTAIGYGALNDNTTGTTNTAVGSGSLDHNTTGDYNTAVGYNALDANTDANNNTAIGYQAATANTTGSQNVAVGSNSLKTNTTGLKVTAVGYDSLQANTTGAENSGFGRNSLYTNTTGAYNVALGVNALYSNTTANNNTAVGHGSLFTNSTGATNTAVGRDSLKSNTTASNNTAVGCGAMEIIQQVHLTLVWVKMPYMQTQQQITILLLVKMH